MTTRVLVDKETHPELHRFVTDALELEAEWLDLIRPLCRKVNEERIRRNGGRRGYSSHPHLCGRDSISDHAAHAV
jgi:hypothetical protein